MLNPFGLSGMHATQNRKAGMWTPLEILLLRCNIYTDMMPSDKQTLVRELQNLDLIICMVGDGANDTAAMRAANVGLSISSSSITGSQKEFNNSRSNFLAAPFMSFEHHIGIVSKLLCEGRCSVITCISLLKYLYLYMVVYDRF